LIGLLKVCQNFTNFASKLTTSFSAADYTDRTLSQGALPNDLLPKTLMTEADQSTSFHETTTQICVGHCADRTHASMVDMSERPISPSTQDADRPLLRNDFSQQDDLTPEFSSHTDLGSSSTSVQGEEEVVTDSEEEVNPGSRSSSSGDSADDQLLMMDLEGEDELNEGDLNISRSDWEVPRPMRILNTNSSAIPQYNPKPTREIRRAFKPKNRNSFKRKAASRSCHRSTTFSVSVDPGDDVSPFH
jgi:hypothetical protein